MFETIIGHARQKNILERQIESQTLSHAYLFSGPSGIGKEKLAESLAIEIIKSGLSNKERPVSIQHADIKVTGLEDAPIKIKDIREMIAETNVLPLEGDYRVFIIDHADRMNPIAQNAILKTIEEPAEGNVFILVTDNPTALLPTILSRCQELPFHDLTFDEKKKVLSLEKIEGSPEDWTVSPGMIIEDLKNPEHRKKLESYFEQFERIISGDTFEIFKLSEILGKNSDLSKEALDYFIRRLYSRLLQGDRSDQRTLRILHILFDLLDKLSYNINLRLQWESSLIDIILEQ